MLSIFKPLRTLRVLITSAAACALMACGGGGSSSGGTNSGTTPAPAATSVGGMVQDGAGAPLAGATVAANGLSVTTGADGSYTFSLDAATTTTVVLVKKSGFTTSAKEVPVAAGNTTLINMKLFADQVSSTFSASAAQSIAVSSATVQIPANALTTAAGVVYTGTVSIGASYYSPDTVQGVQAFAGPYIVIPEKLSFSKQGELTNLPLSVQGA
jgi:Carboxypeptidase regulatory-like domain